MTAPVAEAPSTVTLPLIANEPTSLPEALPLVVRILPPLRSVTLPMELNVPLTPFVVLRVMVPPSATKVTGVR